MFEIAAIHATTATRRAVRGAGPHPGPDSPRLRRALRSGQAAGPRPEASGPLGTGR